MSMYPSQVKTTYCRTLDTLEQTTVGVLGHNKYKIIRQTEYEVPTKTVNDEFVGPFQTKHDISIVNEHGEWVPVSLTRAHEVLVAFGIVHQES